MNYCLIETNLTQLDCLDGQDDSGLYKNQTKGRIELSIIVDQLNIRPREDTIEAALRLYKLAVHRDFLRGRRTSTVCCSCILRSLTGVPMQVL